jgi:hypothetical protein
MIKFFRTIRKDLMEKNKTGKYLKYAIGEIVLVVIGILIALQINNWNENRKLDKEEVLVLNSLHEDLELAKKQSETNILTEQELKKALIFIINFQSNKSELKKAMDLDSVFNHGLWSLGGDLPVINAYSDYKNTGKIGLIKNKNLRKKFTDLEMSLNQLKEMTKDRMNVQQIRIDNIAENDINFILLTKRSIPELNIENEIVNDYNITLNNFRIRNLLTIKLRMTDDVILFNEDLKLEILNIMTLIDTELNNKK